MKIGESLKLLEITTESVTDTTDVMKVVKKAFLKAALIHHPDKGGDQVVFLQVQEAWETLRASIELGADLSKDLDFDPSSTNQWAAQKKKRASYSFFTNLPTTVPYKVEVAASDKSTCVKSKQCIAKGELRVLSYVEELGSYGRPVSVSAFRTPYVIQLGLEDVDLTDPGAVEAALDAMADLSITGFSVLSTADRAIFATRVADKANWAKTATKVAAEITEKTNDRKEAASNSEVGADALADPTKTLPVPGVDGVADALKGKTVVLTGSFGIAGLNGGKGAVAELVKNFNGKVTGSISKKTDFLLLGDEPGLSKVTKAREMPNCQLLTMETLVAGLRSGKVKEQAEATPVEVDEFSRGFQGNGKKYLASPEQLAIAAGKTPLAIKETKRMMDDEAGKDNKKVKTVYDGAIGHMLGA